MQTRNYSQRSIDTYIHLLRELEEYYKCSIDELSADQVKDFLQYSISERNLSVLDLLTLIPTVNK